MARIIRTRFATLDRHISYPVIVTQVDGRFIGSFMPLKPGFPLPTYLLSTYEADDLHPVLRNLQNDLEMMDGYALCVPCGHYHHGEEYTYDGVTEWMCYPCGQDNGCEV